MARIGILKHPILHKWLWGTTCTNYYVERRVLAESGTHILLKHGSHPDYVNRVSGTKNCCSYAALYNKADLMELQAKHNSALSKDGRLKTWEGRQNLNKIFEECKEMGIDFGNPMCFWSPWPKETVPKLSPSVTLLIEKVENAMSKGNFDL